VCREACLEVRPDLDPNKTALEMLTKLKGSVGSAMARRLIDHYPDSTTWPQSLRKLIKRLDSVL